MATWFMQHLIITSLLAVAVALFCRAFRARPALCYALWLLVMLRLLVPPVIAWPWNPAAVIGAFQHFVSGQNDSRNVTQATAGESTALRFLRLIGNETGAASEAATGPSREARLAGTARTALLGAWAIGSLSMICLQFVRIMRFRRISSAAKEASARLLDITDEIARLMEVKSPVLATSSEIASAVTWNVLRPKVLVPSKLADEMDDEHCRVVLAHEIAHLKRRDHWSGWIELAAACVWWWNPVFWYARRRLHEAAEMACDAWVIWALPDRRRQYAETLIRVAELAAQMRGPAPVLGMGSGPSIAFERRLLMILRQQIPCKLSVHALFLVLSVAALVTPGWSQDTAKTAAASEVQASVPEESALPSENELEKELDSPASVEFADIHVGEIMEFIADTYDVNIALDWRVIAYPLHQPPLKPGQTAPAKPAHPPVKECSTCVTDGFVPYLNVNDVPLHEALSAVLIPLGLTFSTSADVLCISSPAMNEADAKRPPNSLTGASPALAKTLTLPCSIEFENIHLSEVLEFISDSWNMNIVADGRAIRPSSKSGLDEKMDPTLFVTDGIVNYINLGNVPLSEALDILCRSLNLSYKAENDVVWISSYALIGMLPSSKKTPDASQ